MELDELKNVWSSIDERLKKQEILNESIVREMIDKKTNRSLKQLFLSDSIGIPLSLALIPFLVYAYGRFGGKHTLWDLTVIVAGVFCIIYLPVLVYRVYGLMKIDLSENIKSNLYYINRYSLQIKWEKIIMKFFIPAFYILISIVLLKVKTNIFGWVIWFSLVIFVVLYGYWSYKKIYDKNIESIKKSLEELNELKEE